MAKRRKAKKLSVVQSGDDPRHAKVVGQSVGQYKDKLSKLRSLGIDPMRGKSLKSIKSLRNIPEAKKKAISRTFDVYADLFALPHVVVPMPVPALPPAPRQKSGKRFEAWKKKKLAHDEAMERRLAAQDFGGHKILDKNLKAAVIPVVAGDPKTARFYFIGGKPVLKDAQGRKYHVPLDHTKLTDGKYIDRIVKKYGAEKRYQIVLAGNQYVAWNVPGSSLKKRLAQLDKSSGKRLKSTNLLRGLLVYKENSVSRAQRRAMLKKVMAARAAREAQRAAEKRKLSRERSRRYRGRKSQDIPSLNFDDLD